MTTELAELREWVSFANNRDICLDKPIQELFDECLNFISVSDFCAE